MSPFSCAPVLILCSLLFAAASFQALSSSTSETTHFEKDGLAFDYLSSWELNDQSNPAAQQITLLDKTVDAQVMIIALRGAITNTKQEEQAKTRLIEPSITRLLKQYEDAAIRVERIPLRVDVNGILAEGAQLRFAVDGQPGITDVCWLVVNQHLVQLFFMRPEKTAAQATAWLGFDSLQLEY